MQTDIVYRLLGLASMTLTVLTCAVALVRSRRIDTIKPISSYLVVGKRNLPAYSISLTTAHVLMSAFLLGWLVPTLRLPVFFVAATLLALVFQLGVAWVPFTRGRAKEIHQWCANGTGAALPVMLLMLLLAPATPHIAAVVTISAFVVFLICGGIWVTTHWSRRYDLLLQSICIAAFYDVLVTVIFTA